MSALNRRRLRLWLDAGLLVAGEQIKDYDRSIAPRLIQGNALDLEAALFAGTALDELDEIESIVVTFKASQISEAAALASVEVEAADFNTDLTADEFKAPAGVDTPWHARFQFSDAQMTWDLDGAAEMDAWLVITAMLADGSERTLGFGPVTMVQDNDAVGAGVLPAAIFTVTNDELRILCPDGTTRRVLLSDL